MRWIIVASVVGMGLLLAHVLPASNAIPCLLAGGISFVPVPLLPKSLQRNATAPLTVIEIESVQFVALRPLAQASDAQVQWDPATRTAELHSERHVLQLQALAGREFWTSSQIAELTACVPQTVVARCPRIVDGDTIRLDDGSSVRYVGVDTPETKHPRRPVEFFGRQASLFNKGLVEGKHVTLEFDVQRSDRYGRVLAYVYVGELFVNAELLAKGYAQMATYPPNVRYVELFAYLQKDAREAGRGLWGFQQPQTEEVPASEGRYVGSRNSDVYHLPHCRSAAGISVANAVWFDSPAAAQRAGYRPCRTCRPPD